MELLDSRRITGPNILSAEPGAIIDVRLDDDEQAHRHFQLASELGLAPTANPESV